MKQNLLTTDDILKLKAIVLYIVNKCGEIDIYHLLKIIYFADREHYAQWGTRLTADNYCAMENGPVASNLYDALKAVTSNKFHLKGDSELHLIADSLYKVDQEFNYFIGAKEPADMDELAASDITCLNHSIEENLKSTFGELSKKSHDEAWLTAYTYKKNSIIDTLLMAKAGGASEDTLNYIRENEEINSMLAI